MRSTYSSCARGVVADHGPLLAAGEHVQAEARGVAQPERRLDVELPPHAPDAGQPPRAGLDDPRPEAVRAPGAQAAQLAHRPLDELDAPPVARRPISRGTLMALRHGDVGSACAYSQLLIHPIMIRRPSGTSFQDTAA